MNARTPRQRKISPTPWLAAGAVLLAVAFVQPPAVTFAADPLAERAVMQPAPTATGTGKPPLVTQNNPQVVKNNPPLGAINNPPAGTGNPPTNTPTPTPKSDPPVVNQPPRNPCLSIAPPPSCAP